MTPTPRQAVILNWLNRAHPHAGRMFESALWVAADVRIPCRGRLIAHAYREICSVLMNEFSSNSREVLADKLNLFAAELHRLGIPLEPGPALSASPDSTQASVPESFLRAAAGVVRIHEATETARTRSRTVFERLAPRRGVQPDIGPSADRWFKMSSFFPKWAHDRTTSDVELMEGQFQQETEFFEETLSAFAEPAIPNLDALDDILEDANT